MTILFKFSCPRVQSALRFIWICKESIEPRRKSKSEDCPSPRLSQGSRDDDSAVRRTDTVARGVQRGAITIMFNNKHGETIQWENNGLNHGSKTTGTLHPKE